RCSMPPPERDRAVLLVILLASIVMAIHLGGRIFGNNDEARFPLLAQAALERGEWFFPRINGAVYHTKPLLLAWLIAVLSLPLRGGRYVPPGRPRLLRVRGGGILDQGRAGAAAPRARARVRVPGRARHAVAPGALAPRASARRAAHRAVVAPARGPGPRGDAL